MNHTECEDCKLRNGDCGHHFKMNGKGKTNYDIPSLSACDRYGNCEFFQQEERPQGDLISRSALREDLRRFFPIEVLEGIEPKTLFAQIMHDIDNAPTVTFMISPDYVTELQNLNKELIKQLEEAERPQGEWQRRTMNNYLCSNCHYNVNSVESLFYKFCPKCGADMRGGDKE